MTSSELRSVMFEGRAPVDVVAVACGEDLWIAPAMVAPVTGWEPKPEGLCRGEACIPVPRGREAEFLGDDGFNLAAFARLRGQPVVHDDAGGVWVIGDPAARQAASSDAPDFELPDLAGRRHSLAQYRGRKIVILSWASWCGCRRDLPIWQALHDELEDEGFTLLSVAADSGGAAATGEWLRAAGATHPALIDEWHVVTGLYGFQNVPNAVWIDAAGRIVRPAETAGAVDTVLDRETLARTPESARAWETSRTAYLQAIRDWVRTGRHALGADEVRRRGPARSDAAVTAAAHHRLGTWLMRRGDEDAAQRHFAEAVRLEPERWTYRRDAWAQRTDPHGGRTPLSAEGRSAQEYWAALDALGDRRFYPPPAFGT